MVEKLSDNIIFFCSKPNFLGSHVCVYHICYGPLSAKHQLHNNTAVFIDVSPDISLLSTSSFYDTFIASITAFGSQAKFNLEKKYVMISRLSSLQIAMLGIPNNRINSMRRGCWAKRLAKAPCQYMQLMGSNSHGRWGRIM